MNVQDSQFGMSPPATHIDQMFLSGSWVKISKNYHTIPNQAPESAVLENSLKSKEIKLSGSSHDVYKTELHSTDKEPVPVYFKLCDQYYPPILAQIEAAMSHSYRIIRGENSAKLRPVIDNKGDVIGTVSFEIRGFKSFFETPYTVENLLNWNVAEELVARYVREEDDLHPGNWGISGNGKVSGIDFDMSLYSITSTSQLKGCRMINNGIFAPTTDKCFNVTDRDLEQFPILQDQQPCHWPTKKPNNGNFAKNYTCVEVFQELAKHPLFIQQKWYAFLLELMIPQRLHKEVLQKHFSKNDTAQSYFEKITSHFAQRLGSIKGLLIQNNSFRKFLVEGKELLVQIKTQFRENHDSDIPELLESCISDIDDQYLNLIKNCMAKDLMVVIHEMGQHLESATSKKIHTDLIKNIEAFVREADTFTQSFFNFELKLKNLQIEHQSSHWLIPEGINKILHNYRGFVATTVLCQSIVCTNFQSLLPQAEKKIEPVTIICNALYQWMMESENQWHCVKIINGCLNTYTSGLMLCRHRKSEFEVLEKTYQSSTINETKKFQAFVQFLQTGAWKSTSANTTLLDALVNTVLEQFKNHLSLTLLKFPDLRQVCDMVNKKKWIPANHLFEIAGRLKELASKII